MEEELKMATPHYNNTTNKQPSTRAWIKKLFEFAYQEKATDIFLTKNHSCTVELLINQKKVKLKSPNKDIFNKAVNILKIYSGIRVELNTTPASKLLKIYISNKQRFIRVSILPTTNGLYINCRLQQKNIETNLYNLGFKKEQINIIYKYLNLEHGLILICGPCGSGKTTSLYSF